MLVFPVVHLVRWWAFETLFPLFCDLFGKKLLVLFVR